MKTVQHTWAEVRAFLDQKWERKYGHLASEDQLKEDELSVDNLSENWVSENEQSSSESSSHSLRVEHESESELGGYG